MTKLEKALTFLSRRNVVLLLACLLTASLVFSVVALILAPAQEVDVQVVVTSPGNDIKIYSDAGCTNLVTSVTANLGQGAICPKLLYIKNHSGENYYTLYWHSNVSTASDKITDHWNRDYAYPHSLWLHPSYILNGTLITPGAILETYYHIIVGADTPLATYSWTLTLYVGS